MCKNNKNNSTDQVNSLFSDVFNTEKPVKISFTAPELSNLGGLSLVSKAAKDSRLIEKFASLIPEWRSEFTLVHTIPQLVCQRVMQIAAGFEDADDCDALRHDSILKMCVGRNPNDIPLASQPTMTRLENRVTHRELYNMGHMFVEHFISSYEKEPKRIILDFDDSNSNAYGAQQLTLFNDYYHEYCYMPLFVFEGYSGKLVLPILRPGRPNKRANVAGLMIRLIEKLREKWKNTFIVIRGDSMFCSPEFMKWAAEQDKVRFITGLSGNSVLNRLTASWVEEVRKEYGETGKDIRHYHEFLYKAGTWKQKERVIVKIEHNEMGLNVRYVVTSLKDKNPRRLYEKKYCKRGDCELYIKEMKNGAFADRMSCHKFTANQFRLYLSGLAYILLEDVRHKMFRKSSLKSSTLITLRNKIILSPVKVTEQKTQIKVEFQPNHPRRGWLRWNLMTA